MKKVWVISLMLLVSFAMYAGETIKLWHGWMPYEKNALKQVIQKYEAVSGNKIEVLNVPFDALQGKFSIMSPQNQGPDLIIGPADWIGSLAEQKLLSPIDDLATEKDRKTFIPNALTGCFYSGKLYGLPESIHIVSFYYNKELIQVPPTNTKELISMGLAVTNEKAGKYGLVYDKGNYYFHAPWVGGFGGKILSDDFNPTFSSKAQIDAAKFVKSLTEKPTKIMPDDIDYNTTMMLFSNGSAGMMLNGNWALSDLIKSGKVKFGVAPIPTISQTGKPPLPIIGPEVIMMPSKSRNRTLAYDFIKFFTSEVAQEEFAAIGHLPSRDPIYESPRIKANGLYEYFKAFRQQIEDSTPMPTAAEMNRGIWGEGNIFLSRIFTETESIENIAKSAQVKAQTSINEYRQSRK